MSAPQQIQFNREDFPEDAPAWLDSLLEKMQLLSRGQAEQLSQGLTFSENFQAQVKTIHYTGIEVPWTAMALEADVDPYGSGFRDPSYRMLPGGIVELAGLASSALGPTLPIAVLPDGYRPAYDQIFVNSDSSAFGEIRVATDGTVSVIIGAGVTDYVSLDGFRFQATMHSAVPVASPPRFTTDGYPLNVQHSLKGKVTGVIPMGTRLLGYSSPISAGQPNLDWENAGDNQIRIHSIFGVSPGQKYETTLLLVTR
jgi:hypothetical protein